MYRWVYSFLSEYSSEILSVFSRFSPLWLKIVWMCETSYPHRSGHKHDVVLVVAAEGLLLEAVGEQLDVPAAAERVLVRLVYLAENCTTSSFFFDVDFFAIFAEIE